MQVLLAGSVFSSDRVDYLLQEDSFHELDLIQEQLYQLDQLQFQLKKLEFHVAKKVNGENVYLKFERIAGAIVLSGVIAGSASIYFPPGVRAMMSAYIAVRGIKSGMLVLSEKDANQILSDLIVLRLKIASSKKTLNKTSQYYCKLVDTHDLCR